jgi:hypothetical protein
MMKIRSDGHDAVAESDLSSEILKLSSKTLARIEITRIRASRIFGRLLPAAERYCGGMSEAGSMDSGAQRQR